LAAEVLVPLVTPPLETIAVPFDFIPDDIPIWWDVEHVIHKTI
jgi:hypothetical protein